jgi:hypothetical protein
MAMTATSGRWDLPVLQGRKVLPEQMAPTAPMELMGPMERKGHKA